MKKEILTKWLLRMMSGVFLMTNEKKLQTMQKKSRQLKKTM